MGEGGAPLVPGLWLERTEELGIISEATCRGVRMGALRMTPSGPVEPGSAGGGGGGACGPPEGRGSEREQRWDGDWEPEAVPSYAPQRGPQRGRNETAHQRARHRAGTEGETNRFLSHPS